MTHAQSGKQPSNRIGLILSLFGLPFFCFGSFAAYKTVALLTTWHAAKNWVEVDADITSVELEEHRDDDSTTFEVLCTYVYSFQGTSCDGDRVGLDSGADNIGSWQQDTFRRLKQHQDRGEPVICFVDPGQPGRAVLDRKLRPAMVALWLVFATVFSVAGVGMIGGGIHLRRAAGKAEGLRAAHPDQPWMWNEQWAQGRLQAGTMLKTLMFWGIAIFWNGISSTVVFLLVPEVVMRERQYWALAFLVFPLIGLVLVILAIRQTVVHLKFGRSHFQLKTLPGLVGGHLRGDMILHGSLGRLQTVNVTLCCIESVTTGSGKNSSTHTNTLWKQTKQYDAEPVFSQNQASTAVEFQIPHDCRSTDDSQPRRRIKWVLQATADVPGVDLSLSFDVPVFRTKDSDPAIGSSEEAAAAQQAIIESEDSPTPGKICRVTDRAGNEWFVVSAWPGFVTGLMLFIMWAVFTGVAVFSVIKLLDGEWFFIPFLLGFGLFSLILSLLLLSFVGKFRCRIMPRMVIVKRSFVFFALTRTIAVGDIQEITHKQSARSGGTKYYAVYLVGGARRRIKAGGMIKGESAARWLVKRIEEQIKQYR